MAFTRGIPWLARHLLQWVPEGKAVPGVQTATGGHRFDGSDLRGRRARHRGAGVPHLGLIFHLMPYIGLDLLDMARAVAAFDLPMRVAQRFAGFIALK